MPSFTASWGWPQWVVVALELLSIVVHCSKNGEQKKGTYDGVNALLTAWFFFWVLSKGGFFN